MESVQPLLSACEEGNTDFLETVLNKGVCVNSVDDNGTTALQVAAANGHECITRLLLMRGAALDQANNLGWTPLMHAARYGHKNVLALLMQNNADINARNSLGASALTLAARGGHLHICKLLVESGIDLSPSTGIGESTCEVTPLMAAALHGHDNIVRYLLDRGFDVNYRTPSMGINALMLAALNGHMATAQILLERGADPNLTNVNDLTPLEVASVRGKREVKGFLDRKTTNKPKTVPEDVKPDIIEAAKAGDVQRMREILDEDPSQRDAVSPQDGATPLMFAAMTGRLDMVQLLVEKGCSVNKRDSVSGWTALMQATYHGKKQVAKYLINAGADVLVAAKNGCTAFDMASLIDDVDTELYRLLAARALQVSRPEKGKKSWTLKPNGTPPSAMGLDHGVVDQPKNALKAWWNRMSNRFRNLKLGSTFRLPPNRLAPIPSPDEEGNSVRKKSNMSPRLSKQELKKSVSADPLGVDPVSTNVSIKSYETMMLETRKSASVYSLGITPQMTNNSIADSTLKPSIPPFKPLPTFQADRPKMPPSSTRLSMPSLDSNTSLIGQNKTPSRSVVHAMKFLPNYSSNQNLHVSSTSPSASTAFKYTDRSPSSSGGASGITCHSKGKSTSSATSSTLTPGSDHTIKTVGRYRSLHAQLDSAGSSHLTHSRHGIISAGHGLSYSRNVTLPRQRTSHISPNSSTSETSSLPRRKTARSGSSRDSTASTLTPSPSPTPKPPGVSTLSSSSHSSSSMTKSANNDDDELGGLLKKLSLERYQPIFEEQEVDMEAFLTLSDNDLEELGIGHPEPRRQILAAITELNSGKGRERQHFHETMSSFRSTMTRNRFSDSGSVSLSKWDLAEENQQLGASHKSRAS